MLDSGLVGWLGRGAARAEDARGTPTQSHISPSILVYEERSIRRPLCGVGCGVCRVGAVSYERGTPVGQERLACAVPCVGADKRPKRWKVYKLSSMVQLSVRKFTSCDQYASHMLNHEAVLLTC